LLRFPRVRAYALKNPDGFLLLVASLLARFVFGLAMPVRVFISRV